MKALSWLLHGRLLLNPWLSYRLGFLGYLLNNRYVNNFDLGSPLGFWFGFHWFGSLSFLSNSFGMLDNRLGLCYPFRSRLGFGGFGFNYLLGLGF